MGVHWKKGEFHKKTIYRGNCLKRGLGQFADLRKWGLVKKRDRVFEGGLICQ